MAMTAIAHRYEQPAPWSSEREEEMKEESSALMEALKAATDGLRYASESDAPLEPFVWEDEGDPEPSPDVVFKKAGLPADAPVRKMSLAAFFKPMTQEQDWFRDREKATAERFRSLETLLKSRLHEIKAYKIGKTEADVYVVGKAPGVGLAGAKTKVVET
jgi:hypothetical protein